MRLAIEQDILATADLNLVVEIPYHPDIFPTKAAKVALTVLPEHFEPSKWEFILLHRTPDHSHVYDS